MTVSTYIQACQSLGIDRGRLERGNWPSDASETYTGSFTLAEEKRALREERRAAQGNVRTVGHPMKTQ